MSNYDKVALPPPPNKNGYLIGGEYLTDITWGQWIPAGQEFHVPGDVIRCGQNAFIRTVPLVTVPFTSFHIKFVTFFTPLRILDEDASKIITGFDEDENSFEGSFDDWVVTKDSDVAKWSYFDYMSFQTMDKATYDKVPSECKPADYWRKNLYRIYNEWLREPNLQAEVDEDSNNEILNSNYRRDRYTAALLTPQLGPEATIGIDASNSVTFPNLNDDVFGYIANRGDIHWTAYDSNGYPVYQGIDIYSNKGDMQLSLYNNYDAGNYITDFQTKGQPLFKNEPDKYNAAIMSQVGAGNPHLVNKDPRESLARMANVDYLKQNSEYSDDATYFGFKPDQNFLDFLNANTLDVQGGIGILDLRLAFAKQMLAERMNRVGSRYNEYLRANYGIAPRDETLQRPVFLGSSVAPILVNEVTQMSESGITPLGDIAGKGVSMTTSYTHRYLVKEFGITQTLMTIIPDAYYSQGIPKKYTYKSKMDFFNPLFQSVGEIEVKNSELYINGTSHGNDPDEDGDNGTWGFEPIYEELRHGEKRICGSFRDDLDTWTLARKFATRPYLNGEFVKVKSDRDDLNRIFVSIDDTKIKPFHIHLYNDIRALRPIIRDPIGATLKGM